MWKTINRMSIICFKVCQHVQHNVMVHVLAQVTHHVVSCPNVGFTLQAVAMSILISNLHCTETSVIFISNHQRL